MSKNVAVFVDVANIFYAAKAAGVDIDYVTLLKSASAGRDLVRAYAYTGLDPENENQRNFHSFLARNGYRVVSKDIRKYGDGKVKANLDIELVVDMLKTARNLDIAIVVSGDGDFAPAIRAVQEMGVRVEVISFRGNTSSDLMDVADQFTDITALARVEKGSSRSGRRVAGDEEDLSMTEVPDKQTEGSTSRARGAGGRRRGRGEAAAPAAARGRGAAAAAGRGRGRTAMEPVAPAVAAGAAPVVALPGEKLSRAAVLAEPVEESETMAAPESDELPAPSAAVATAGEVAEGGEGGEDAEGERRRRRRRGGRGRGRGRGRAEGGETPELEPVAAARTEPEVDEEELAPEPPRGPRPTPFGSVWDSQLGVPTPRTPAPTSAPLPDEEDFEEPAIPEYLIAERQQQRGGRGGMGPGAGRGMGGGRGGRNRSAYAAAIERERYGRGGGGGINRYPDVSGRERERGERERGERERAERDRGGRGQREQGGGRGERPQPARAPGSSEPWSEVPPEVEAMLRAQMAQHSRPPQPPDEAPEEEVEAAAEAPPATTVEEVTVATPPAETETATEAPKRRSTRRRTAPAAAPPEASTADVADAAPEAGAVAETPAPKRTPRRRTTAAASASEASTDRATTPDAGDEAPEKPKRRSTRRSTHPAEEPGAVPSDSGQAPEAAGTTAPEAAPKRTTRRRSAATGTTPGSDEPAEKPKRRATRRTMSESTEPS